MRSVLVGVVAALAMAPLAFGDELVIETSAPQVDAGFLEGVQICVRSAISGAPISELPDYLKVTVEPAEEKDHAFALAPPGAPIYRIKSILGVIVAEPGEGRCTVTGISTDARTEFGAVEAVLTRSEFGFVKTGNHDTAEARLRSFRKESAEGGEITVHLDAGDPGLHGRTSEFPLVLAYVTRTGRASAPIVSTTNAGAEAFLDLVFGYCFPAEFRAADFRHRSADSLTGYRLMAPAAEAKSGDTYRVKFIDGLELHVEPDNKWGCSTQARGGFSSDLAARIRGFVLSQSTGGVVLDVLKLRETPGAPIIRETMVTIDDGVGSRLPLVLVEEVLDPSAPVVKTNFFVANGQRIPQAPPPPR